MKLKQKEGQKFRLSFRGCLNLNSLLVFNTSVCFRI